MTIDSRRLDTPDGFLTIEEYSADLCIEEGDTCLVSLDKKAATELYNILAEYLGIN